MAPVSSRKDKTTTNKQPHASNNATRFPSVLPNYNMAIRYPSALERAPNNILQMNTLSTPCYGYQGYQRMPEPRRIDHISTEYTLSGTVTHYESYDHDHRRLQNEASQNVNSSRTQPQPEISTKNVPNAYFGNARGHILPNVSSDPLNRMHPRMHHKNSLATPDFFNQVSLGTGEPRISQSHCLYYPKGSPSTSTRNSSLFYATNDRRDINHPNLQEIYSGSQGNVKNVDKYASAQSNAQITSYAGTGQAEKISNFDHQHAAKFSNQLVQDYLNYLIHNGYRFEALQAQKFLALKYPGFKDLANLSIALNELAQIMFTTPKKILPADIPATVCPSFKPPPSSNHNILPVSQAYDIVQNLDHLQHFSGGSVNTGQNMMANTAPFSTQDSSNLFDSSQTSQYTTFSTSSQNSQNVMTKPVPKLVKISPSVGTNNNMNRPHLYGVTKKSVQQNYHNSMQIPYSVAQNISSVINTAPTQPRKLVDLKDECQNILEDKITSMHITTNQNTQSNEYTREAAVPVTGGIFFQNANTRNRNEDLASAVIILPNQSSHTPENQESQSSGSLRTINLQLSNNSVEGNTGTHNRIILPSTNSSVSNHEASSNKPRDADNIEVNDNEKVLPQVHKSAPDHTSPNKPHIEVNAELNNIEKKLLSSYKSALEPKPHVESNIGPTIPSTHNSPERKSPSKPQMESNMVITRSNVKNHMPVSDANTEEIDVHNHLLPENQSLEQGSITKEKFLDEFTSLLCQLDSDNSRTNDLLERLRDKITKSTKTEDSLKKVFSDNLETSDDTVSSTTSSEPV